MEAEGVEMAQLVTFAATQMACGEDSQANIERADSLVRNRRLPVDSTLPCARGGTDGGAAHQLFRTYKQRLLQKRWHH
jgi:hypothetical protein